MITRRRVQVQRAPRIPGQSACFPTDQQMASRRFACILRAGRGPWCGWVLLRTWPRYARSPETLIMMPANPPRHPRYTLRALLAAIGLLALGLSVPGGAILLGSLATWIATGVVVLATLMICQLPVYWLFRVSRVSSPGSGTAAAADVARQKTR